MSINRGTIFWAKDPSKRLKEKRRKWRNDPYHEGRSCTRKLRFATQEAADAQAARLNDQPDSWYHRAAYECWFCDGWHVGRTYNVRPVERPELHEYSLLETFYGFGAREIGCLRCENRGHRVNRRKALASRHRGVLKRLARRGGPVVVSVSGPTQ